MLRGLPHQRRHEAVRAAARLRRRGGRRKPVTAAAARRRSGATWRRHRRLQRMAHPPPLASPAEAQPDAASRATADRSGAAPAAAPAASATGRSRAPRTTTARSVEEHAAAARAASAHPAGLNLTIHYQGEAFPVTKDRFIIGRGKQTSDLTIKDPNVSRQHAMIEFSNGQYYIVDMGSTNGVEYNGQRVARKVINEGDQFKVCDHELRFSYG